MISQKTYTGVKCSYSLVNSSSYNFHSLCKDIRGGGFHYIRLTQCGKILPTSSLDDVSRSPNFCFLLNIIFHGIAICHFTHIINLKKFLDNFPPIFWGFYGFLHLFCLDFFLLEKCFPPIFCEF